MRYRFTPAPPISLYHTYKRYKFSDKTWLQTTIYDDYTAIAAVKSIEDDPWVQTPSSKSWRNPLVFRDVTSITEFDNAVDTIHNEFIVDYWTTYRYYYTYTSNYCIWSMGTPTPPTLPDIPESILGAAFRSIQPDYKTFKVDGINIYSIILELADLKKLFTKSAYALSMSFRDIPEKNLLINFAILPLYGDLCAIYDIVTKLNNAIDKWNEGALKGVTWDLHRIVSGLPTPITTTSPGYETSQHPYGFAWYRTGGTSLTASGKVHLYFRPKPISKSDRRKIFQAAIGVDRPVLGAWEAVPFSWAIDYFLHIDKLIARWDEALPSLFTYDFVSAGYSLKQEAFGYYDFDVILKPSTTWRKPNTTTTRLSRVKKTTKYIRRGTSLQSMESFMSRPEDYQLGWDKGWRQASYLTSVAYLLGFKR